MKASQLKNDVSVGSIMNLGPGLCRAGNIPHARNNATQIPQASFVTKFVLKFAINSLNTAHSFQSFFFFPL